MDELAHPGRRGEGHSVNHDVFPSLQEEAGHHAHKVVNERLLFLGEGRMREHGRTERIPADNVKRRPPCDESADQVRLARAGKPPENDEH